MSPEVQVRNQSAQLETRTCTGGCLKTFRCLPTSTATTARANCNVVCKGQPRTAAQEKANKGFVTYVPPRKFSLPPTDPLAIAWDVYVLQGKDHVAALKSCRMKIVDLAIKACSLGQGLGVTRNFSAKQTGQYTVENFADAIGLPRSSLTSWIHVKKSVVDKLEAFDDVGGDDFTTAVATLKRLRAKKETDPRLVQATFTKIAGERQQRRVVDKGPKPMTVIVQTLQTRLAKMPAAPEFLVDLRALRLETERLLFSVDKRIGECPQ